jgi:3-methyladenine DNA glycosylase AlkD
MGVNEAKADIRKHADPERAKGALRFFKTGKGEYGEGDRFLGLAAADVREVARKHRDLGFDDLSALIRSRYHEDRSVALLILAEQFRRGDERARERIYRFYLRSTRHINGWDLVDLSADKIVGAYLDGRDAAVLRDLARSESLWERRIAIIATLHFIRRGRFDLTLDIAEALLDDEHDLIHKAVGWMLREVGKRDRAAEECFLRRHCRRMPRTMLRYAIEKFPEPLRKRYLEGRV